MKAESYIGRSALVLLLMVLAITPIRGYASGGSITSIETSENPINETAVEIIVDVGVKVQFDSPGYYVILIRDDSTGSYLAESLIYSVGAVTDEKTVTLRFQRSRQPGMYSYTAILKMKDSSSGWFDADTEHFSIVVSPPQVITNVTTVTVTETVTKAMEYITTVTQTVTRTLTLTQTTTRFNLTTLTILKTVTHNVTQLRTVTRNITKTRTVTRTVAASKGAGGFDLRMVGLGVIAVLVAILLLMALRRR